MIQSVGGVGGGLDKEGGIDPVDGTDPSSSRCINPRSRRCTDPVDGGLCKEAVQIQPMTDPVDAQIQSMHRSTRCTDPLDGCLKEAVQI